jgi:hypothetical protein
MPCDSPLYPSTIWLLTDDAAGAIVGAISSNFSELSICAASKNSIRTYLKYEKMTPVQAQSIPTALTGADMIVKAKTGTGNKHQARCTPATALTV